MQFSRIKTKTEGCVLMTMACLFSSALSATELTAPEVVAEWNSLPYQIQDQKIRTQWESSELYGKALVQGLKLDSHGTMYVSTARWGGSAIPATLSKLVKESDGKYTLHAFPNEHLNDVNNPDGLKAVLGFEVDRNDVMWILDQGHIAGAPSAQGDQKLVLWDLKNNKELQRYNFSNEEADQKCSFLNDITVDNDSGFAYIADSGIFCSPLHGGLIIYDSINKKARRILDQSDVTNDQPGFIFNIDNRPVTKSSPMKTGADGIVLSGDKKTLYWTNLTGNKLYSLETDLLRDFSVSEESIRKAVKVENILPSNTDGITADREGNLYMSALTLNGLMYRDHANGAISRLTFNPEMSWPDTLAWGPEGSLYVMSNHLNRWVDGDMNFKDPLIPNFRIWKLPLNKQSYLKP